MADWLRAVGLDRLRSASALDHDRLASLIRANRFTIAVVFPTVGALTLIASAEGWLPPLLAFNAALLLFGTLVMRSPLLVGAAPLVTRRAGLVLVGLVGYTYAIEMIGVATGRPYGPFAYGVDLGPMLLGVPLALPLFFVPLVANAYLLTLLAVPTAGRRWWVRVPAAVAVVMVIDLILDPGAVALGFWAFEGGGDFYDVPVSNYVGWLLSGTVAVLAIELAVPVDAVRKRLTNCEFILDDLVSFVLLWGVVNLWFGQSIPVVLTGGLVFALFSTGRYKLPVGDRLRRRLYNR